MSTIDLREGGVRLRPLAPADLAELAAAWPLGGFAGNPPANSHEAMRRLQRRVERSGRLVDGRLDLAVEAGGRLVGTIEARQPAEGLPPGVFELGIGLFTDELRGRGTGTAAVRLLTGYLFEAYPAHRVQASTAIGNSPMRRVLEKVGYTFEGVLRSFLPIESGRDDAALYGVTRSEWESLH